MSSVGVGEWLRQLPPDEVDTSDDITEIKVTADRLSYVVALQLTQQDFEVTLQAASAVTQQTVEDFVSRWHGTRVALTHDPAER